MRRPALGGPVADVEAAGLVVGRVRARGELAVAALAGQPGLEVVLLGRRGAEVVDGDRHHAVGDLEVLQDRLLDRQQPLVLVRRRPRARRSRTSRPCRTGARGRCRACPCRRRPPRGESRSRSRRSAAAARRRRGSRRGAARPARPRRCRPGRGRRRAGGRSAARCRAGNPVPYSACSRTSTGGMTGSKPSPHELLDRVADERELEQDEIAAQVGKARARQPGGALHVDRAPASSRWSRPVGCRSPTSRRTVSWSGASSAGRLGSEASAASRSARTAVSSSLSSRPRAASAASCSRCSGVGAPLRPRLAGSARRAAPRARW